MGWHFLQYLQHLVCYISVVATSSWLLYRRKTFLYATMFSLSLFLLLHVVMVLQTSKQFMLVIYNIPQHQGIDFIKGDSFQFVGDQQFEDGWYA